MALTSDYNLSVSILNSCRSPCNLLIFKISKWDENTSNLANETSFTKPDHLKAIKYLPVCCGHTTFHSRVCLSLALYFIHLINFVMIVEQIAHICILSPFYVFLGNLSHIAVLSAALSFISHQLAKYFSRWELNGIQKSLFKQITQKI